MLLNLKLIIWIVAIISIYVQSFVTLHTYFWVPKLVTRIVRLISWFNHRIERWMLCLQNTYII